MNPPTPPPILDASLNNVLTTTLAEDISYNYRKAPDFDNSAATSSTALSVLDSSTPASDPPPPIRLRNTGGAADHSDRGPLIVATITPNLQRRSASRTTKISVAKKQSTKKKHIKPVSKKPSVRTMMPSYQHSLSLPPSKALKALQDPFLHKAVQGVKDVCLKNNFILSDKSIKSLDDSKGLYVSYISSTIISKATRKFTQQFVLSGGSNVEEYNDQENSDKALKISNHGSKRFGSYVGPSTAQNCERYMRQLYNFLAMIGDYQSMLILLEYPPKNPPPMNPHSILLFVYHRMEAPTTPLCYDHDQSKTTPLIDVFKTPILAEGSCRSKGGLLHLFQPISIVHRSHNLNAKYVAPCPDCRKSYQLLIEAGKDASDFVMCKFHLLQPPPHGIIHGYGDPCTSEKVILAKLAMDKLEKKSGHVATTRDCLMPPEVKQLWKVLFASGFTKDNFMRYTMLIQAITLGNRTCGVLKTTLASLNNHMEFGVNSQEYGIDSIGISVFEKNEKEKTVYSIKFKDNHPWFCFLRHLLVYVWCFRMEGGLYPDPVSDGYVTDKDGEIVPDGYATVKDGPLVPHTVDLATELLYPLPISSLLHKEIKKDPVIFVAGESAEDRSIKTLMLKERSARDYRSKCVTVYNFIYNGMLDNNIIKLEDEVNLGNHSTRKSTYMWSILGGGTYATVREHVRHSTADCEALYRMDACSIKRMVLEGGDSRLIHEMEVYPFVESIVSHTNSSFRRLNKFRSTSRIPNMTSIQCLAEYFVTEMLQVSPTHNSAKDHNYLLNIAYKKKFGKEHVPDMTTLINTTDMSYERRMQFHRQNALQEGQIRELKASLQGLSIGSGMIRQPGAGPTTIPLSPSQQGRTIPSNHSQSPPSLTVFGPSYVIHLGCKKDQPVDEFKLLVYDKEEKPAKNYLLFRMEQKLFDAFTKLNGRVLVFACNRLIHELASLKAYTYNITAAVHTRIDTGPFSVPPNLSFSPIRRHRPHKFTLQYFAHCLYTCHDGKPELFHLYHENWTIASSREKQIAFCLCQAETCRAMKDIIFSDKPKPPPQKKKRRS